MTPFAPQDWILSPTPLDHPDSAALLHAYLDELISRYYHRPSTDAEIKHELDHGEDLSGPHGTFLVAWSEGTPVGCVGVRRLSPELTELTKVFVLPQARRGGAGARIVGAAEDAARSWGATAMRLNTRKDLTEAIGLYHRLGYREIEPYGDDPYAELWFEKDLRPPVEEDAGGAGAEDR
ncbi:GNAT family N-acetyltransferase [Kitasatospora sp. NPDC050543]|uniref:GNAT family N-acetyltransferase n=1 Tax=Kitasatospora sp. NPDC050543 TaxID=3364054 RepID=UPI0037A6C3E1